MSHSWHSYPSMFAFGHRATETIFSLPVTIEEKIDGSQFSFGIIDGVLRLKSKNQELFPPVEGMFELAVKIVESLRDNLHEGWTYRAEYLQKPKHNCMAYTRVPVNHLIIFDINTGHEVYLNYADKKKEAERLGFECIPLLFEGIWTDATKIPELLNRASILGSDGIEGVVIKNYELFGKDKKCIFAKYVTEGYKEIQTKVWRTTNPKQNDILTCLISSLCNEARWNKAIQNVRDRGELEGDPRDIGKLMKELSADLQKECIPYITEELLKWALPHIVRGVGKGFPEWYKKKLIEDTFGSDRE